MKYERDFRAADSRRVPKRNRGRTLSETVYQRLRAQIISGFLAPGTQLFESELAAKHAVSKTPVREALSKLRVEGLVRVLPRRGYLVEPLTVAQVISLFELRSILEGGAAELAAVRITPEQVTELRTLARARSARNGPPTRTAFVRNNRAFHVRAAEACQNDRLVELLGQCLDQLERAFFLGARVADVTSEVHEDHLALIEALAASDAHAARRVVIEQVEHTKVNFLRGLGFSSGELLLETNVHPPSSA